MYKISKDIYDSIGNSIEIEKLGIDICKRIIDRINVQYIENNKEGLLIWEKLKMFEAISDSAGWKFIRDYVQDKSCILFFNQDEEKEMYKIKNGKELEFLLSETSGFEFYVTDMECSYLLCFSHHDTLYGCGEAVDWIREIKERMG